MKLNDILKTVSIYKNKLSNYTNLKELNNEVILINKDFYLSKINADNYIRCSSAEDFRNKISLISLLLVNEIDESNLVERLKCLLNTNIKFANINKDTDEFDILSDCIDYIYLNQNIMFLHLSIIGSLILPDKIDKFMNLANIKIKFIK